MNRRREALVVGWSASPVTQSLCHKTHMLFGDKQLFSIVRSAKLGLVEAPRVLAELRDWIHDNYSSRVVHIVFDHIESGPSDGRPRLNVILETDSDYNALQADIITIQPDFEKRVLTEFAKLDARQPQEYDTNNVLLILDNFSDSALGAPKLPTRDVSILNSKTAIKIWADDFGPHAGPVRRQPKKITKIELADVNIENGIRRLSNYRTVQSVDLNVVADAR